MSTISQDLPALPASPITGNFYQNSQNITEQEKYVRTAKKW